MDIRVFILAIAAFVVGTVELIIGGTLDLISADLQVSLSAAGQLISVFSIVFAISGPILFGLTARFERKKLLLAALTIFFISNVFAFLSPNYTMLMLSRMLSAASGSLLISLCITIVSQIVKPEYRARAIGVIFMGVSGSLVLGVPFGLMLSNAFGWKAPFLFIAALTLVPLASIYFLLSPMSGAAAVPIRKQLAMLKNKKILSAQLTSTLFLTGHLTLYAYLTPFLKTTLNLDPTWITIVYFVFGVAAVMGGGLGGWVVDKWGATRSILMVIVAFLVAIVVLPLVTSSLYVFLGVMALWSMLSWAISPAQQSYIVEISGEMAGIQQTLNNSMLHLGIALGSMVGGVVIEHYSVVYNAWFGAGFVVLALICAVYSMTRGKSGRSTLEQSIINND